MKSNIDKERLKQELGTLFNSKSEESLIERDSLMLQANYLSEIERLSKENGVSRKDIALKINTSPSYLTQVFRGDKPLNFVTLAKIKRALGLRFEIKAHFMSEKRTDFENSIATTQLRTTINGFFPLTLVKGDLYFPNAEKQIA